MVWLGGLVPSPHGGSSGARVYREQCAVCHGVDRAGAPPAFPSLIKVGDRLTDAKITQTIRQGPGRMPSFPNIDEPHIVDLLSFLRTGDAAANNKELASVPAAGSAAQPASDPQGARVYWEHCASCHGAHLEGVPQLSPALTGVGSRFSVAQATKVVSEGRNRMPPIPDLNKPDLAALLRFLGVGVNAGPETTGTEETEGPYIFTGYKKFLDPDGYPAFVPPWGTLSAIDLKTGKYLWKVPLGEYPDLARQGMSNTGSENYGGPILTAGGVLFIGATVFDRHFHAFDSQTGELLWQTELPFAGMATPATYMVDGRQYVVTASSGGRDPKSPVGGAYLSFALPGKHEQKGTEPPPSPK
jgi:mono/diheme cytochrome c family protein